MKAIIKWPNGFDSKIGAHYNETVKAFEERVLHSYGAHDCKILLCVYDEEGYYIK